MQSSETQTAVAQIEDQAKAPATTTTTDQATSPKAEDSQQAKPARERRQRNRRDSRKDGATTSKTLDAQSSTKPASASRQRQKKERQPRDREENLSNVITIGTRLPTNQYVRIIKNVLNQGKHESLELLGFRDQGMAKLTQVVNVLSNWGYISVIRIKTRPDPCLKIVVKKTAEFQKNFDEFAVQLQQRRDEREKLRAEKLAQTETEAEEKKEDTPEATTDDIKVPAADADEDSSAKAQTVDAATEDSSQAATAEPLSTPENDSKAQTESDPAGDANNEQTMA